MSTIAITGGTKGIGAAISKLFASEGWDVYAGARNAPDSDDQLPGSVRFVEMDVRNPADHERIINVAVSETGHLDCYLNCAGSSSWRSVEDIDELFWNQMIDVNLSGTLWGCKAAASSLAEGGSIINVSSLAGKRGSARNSAYCAAKFGVNGITQSLAKELGPAGIRVNAVCPVYVVTPGLREALADPAAPPEGAPVGPFLEQFASANAALKRLPEASEVAQLCHYLASTAASAVTGQCLNVDCGVLPQ